MGIEHAFVVTKIEGALGGTVAKSSGQGRIVEETREGDCQLRGIARAEREAGISKHFDKCADVRGDDWQAPGHILSEDQTEDFAAERRNNERKDVRDRGLELLPVQIAGEMNLCFQSRMADELF